MSDDSAGRLADVLRTWLASAAPGAQLPSTRSLVHQYGVSPVTVQTAVRRLVAADLVESRPGVGSFVRADRTSRPAEFGWQTGALGAPPTPYGPLSSTQRDPAPDAIRLHSGYPTPELLPERLVRSALVRAARSEAATTRSPAGGSPVLQAWFAGEIAASTPTHVLPPSPRDVIIAPGSQSALSSVFRAVVGTGRPLVVESPTYWGAISAAHQAGVVLVPVPSGTTGPDPEEVERAFALTGARAFYAQPTFANPTGAQWSAETGHAVLDVVRRRGAFLVEDDWAHDLGIDAEPHPLVRHDGDGHVVYVRSLTKSVSPALRVAAVVARGPARERILADRAAEGMYVSGLLQAAALDVVSQAGWPTHLRSLRQRLRQRRDLLLQHLRTHAPELHLGALPRGGLNLWVRLPDGADVDAVVGGCAQRGVIVAPGAEWFPAEATGPYLRLNYAAEDPSRFEEAAQLLGDVVRDLTTF